MRKVDRRFLRARHKLQTSSHVLGFDRRHGAAGGERAAAIQFEAVAHGMISSAATLSPSSSKKKRRSTGLPGKLPVRRLVMTVFPSFCSDAKGLLVYVYLPSAFHFLMAAKPL